MGRSGDALQLPLAHVLIFEQALGQPSHALADDHCARFRDGLQAGREIHRLPHRVALAGSDHHHAGGDPDANLQPSGVADLQRRHRLDDVETGANGAFRLAFMGERVAEKGDDSISQGGEHVAVVAIDAGRAGVLVGSDDALQSFRIEPVRELGEADHVAEENGQLAPFASRSADDGGGRRRFFELPLFAEQAEDLLARPEGETKLLQIIVSQQPKRLQIDFVLLEERGEALESIKSEPLGQRGGQHGRPPPPFALTRTPWLTSQPAMASPDSSGIWFDHPRASCNGVRPLGKFLSSGAKARPAR